MTTEKIDQYFANRLRTYQTAYYQKYLQTLKVDILCITQNLLENYEV